MHDIITFGAGSTDIYVKSEKFLAKGRDICVPVGSKTEVEDIMLFSGGGGTNAAATFAKQGFKVVWCGSVGDDVFGKLIIKDLKKFKINSPFAIKTKKKPTNTSVLLVCPGKDRTILVYRGASDCLSKKDIPWKRIQSAKWFYLAPFGGELVDLTENLVDFAKKNNIKVALNPGYDQLTMAKAALERILQKVNVLILNREEAALLVDISFQAAEEKEIFRKLNGLVGGVVIITKGGEGAAACDGEYLYRADSLKLAKVDANGAGDSFGSGFVSGLIQKNDIIYAIQLAMANSGYNITKWGAKEGLLKKGQKWPKVKVIKEKL